MEVLGNAGEGTTPYVKAFLKSTLLLLPTLSDRRYGQLVLPRSASVNSTSSMQCFCVPASMIDLPDEVLNIILSQLPLKLQFVMRRVCKDWQRCLLKSRSGTAVLDIAKVGKHGIVDAYAVVSKYFGGDVVMNVAGNLHQYYESLVARGPGQLTALFCASVCEALPLPRPLDMRPFVGLKYFRYSGFRVAESHPLILYPPGLRCLKIACSVQWALALHDLLHLSLSSPLDYLNFSLLHEYMDLPPGSLTPEVANWPTIRNMFVRVREFQSEWGYLGRNLNMLCGFPGLEKVVFTVELADEESSEKEICFPTDAESSDDDGDWWERYVEYKRKMRISENNWADKILRIEREVDRVIADCQREGRRVRFQWLSEEEDFEAAWLEVERGFIGWTEDRRDEYPFMENYV